MKSRLRDDLYPLLRDIRLAEIARTDTKIRTNTTVMTTVVQDPAST